MTATKTGIIEGLDMVVYARLIEDEKKKTAQRILLQTDGELSEKVKTDSEETKDGSIANSKGLESELSCTAFIDRASDQYKWLTEATRNKKEFGIWLIDMKSSDDNTGKEAQYFQGVISEKKDKMAAEGKMEVEVTFAISGKGKFGTTPVQEFEGNSSADYAFKTTEQVIDEI